MMKKHYKFLKLLLIVFIFLSSRVYAEIDDAEYIDINLTRPLLENDLINLQSENGFLIYTMEDKLNPIFYIEDNDVKVVLDEIQDVILLDIEGNNLFTIPKENNLLLKAGGGQESTTKVEEDRYRGYFRFKIQEGEIILINHIEMEEYLYGVVPAEMGYNFPMEALKAQAVAARTYASRNMSKHLSEDFNLCDSTHCQAYYGYEEEHLFTNLAVDETKGLLAYYDGQPINAFYYSTSSGFTENSIDVWGGDLPYLKSVRDDFSLDSPNSSWTFKIDVFDLNNKLVLNQIYIGLLEKIEVIERSTSGSVKSVKLIGTSGEEIISGTRFRAIMGNTIFKSTHFNIVSGNVVNRDREVYVIGKDGKPILKRFSQLSVLGRRLGKPVSRSSRGQVVSKRDRIEDLLKEESIPAMSTSEIVIEGKGYGHGVGMSQYGAKKMAELGYTFEEILKHYYTGIDIL